MTSRYRNREAVLSSMHEKLPLIAEPFMSALGLTVHNASLDTDAFGTFSGEKKREDSPVMAAEKKARAGMAKNLRPSTEMENVFCRGNFR